MPPKMRANGVDEGMHTGDEGEVCRAHGAGGDRSRPGIEVARRMAERRVGSGSSSGWRRLK